MRTNQLTDKGWYVADTAWVSDFCDSYAPFLLNAGKGLLLLGALLGVLVTVIALRAALATPAKPADASKMTANSVAVLAGIKDFLEALAKAPPWLALFGAGVLLMWMAGSINPEVCGINKPAPNAQSSGSSGGTRTAPGPNPTARPGSGGATTQRSGTSPSENAQANTPGR
jgi:hypothetical protein